MQPGSHSLAYSSNACTRKPGTHKACVPPAPACILTEPRLRHLICLSKPFHRILNIMDWFDLWLILKIGTAPHYNGARNQELWGGVKNLLWIQIGSDVCKRCTTGVCLTFIETNPIT